MGSTLSDITSEAKDQEKLSMGMSVFCCCMVVIGIVLFMLMRGHKSGAPMHHLQRSMGRMPYPSPYGPARFSPSSPMIPYR